MTQMTQISGRPATAHNLRNLRNLRMALCSGYNSSVTH